MLPVWPSCLNYEDLFVDLIQHWSSLRLVLLRRVYEKLIKLVYVMKPVIKQFQSKSVPRV
jgi:hypothetical protein